MLAMMMLKNLGEIDWKGMQDNIKKEVQEIEFTYIADRPLSTHPSDWYLRAVLGYNERGYSTWIYNASLGGLYEGNYGMGQGEAYNDFLSRE